MFKLLIYSRDGCVVYKQFCHGSEKEDHVLTNTLVTTSNARTTGLIPYGWRALVDHVEPRFNAASLDYSFVIPLRHGEEYIDGHATLDRVREVSNRAGSLGFAQYVLEAQAVGNDVLPTRVIGGRRFIVLTRTVLADQYGHQYLPCLSWYPYSGWRLEFRSITLALTSAGVVPRFSH